MSSEDTTKIIVASLGLLSAVGVAVISNVDKIFPVATAEVETVNVVEDAAATKAAPETSDASETAEAAPSRPAPRPAPPNAHKPPRPQPTGR